jgi:hypothetical protein
MEGGAVVTDPTTEAEARRALVKAIWKAIVEASTMNVVLSGRDVNEAMDAYRAAIEAVAREQAEAQLTLIAANKYADARVTAAVRAERERIALVGDGMNEPTTRAGKRLLEGQRALTEDWGLDWSEADELSMVTAIAAIEAEARADALAQLRVEFELRLLLTNGDGQRAFDEAVLAILGGADR